MSALEQDLAYEAQDVRGIIEGWLHRYGMVLGCMLLVMASVSLYAAIATATAPLKVVAITTRGDTFVIPHYDTQQQAQAAAAAAVSPNRGSTSK